MTRRSLLLAALLSFAVPVTAYEVVRTPGTDDPMGVHIYRLDNGLTVYLTENHETPRFYAEVIVRAGSKHDPAESTGLAHYLEHMLFKGTGRIGTLDYDREKPHLDRITELYEEHWKETDPEKRKAIYAKINAESQKAAQYAVPNEIDRLYKSMGGTALNAHTWHEETVYRVDLPSNRLEQWAAIESERFGNAVFRLFQPELEVVYEEKNRTLDNKDRLISYAVAETLFKVHPYGQQTTIGKVEHLKNPSLANMYWFYNTYYVPNNMAIALSGDIDPEHAMSVIEHHFSSWESKPLPEPTSWTEPALQGAERVEVTYEGEEFVLLAFRTASRNHADAEALKLIDMILDNRTAGLINLNLAQRQKVRRAGSYPYLLNDSGAQYLWGVPKADQTLEDVEQLLLDQLAIIKRGEFDESLLDAIVTDFKKTQKSNYESNSGRVRMLRDAYLSFTDWDEARREIERMEQLTRDDVVRVANTYFGTDYVAGYRRDAPHELPEIEKPQIDKIDIDASQQSEFFARVMSMPVEPIKPAYIRPGTDYRKVSYAPGVDLYYSENPFNDLFSLSFTVDLGTNQDNRLGMAQRLLDKSGAGGLDAEELKKAWYRLGTDFSLSAGNNETTITIAGLDENFDASLKLLTSVLHEPTADPAVLEGLVDIVLAERADTKKNHRAIMGGVVLHNRLGDESRYLNVLPNDALAELRVDELHALVGGLLDYRHSIQYVGSLALDDITTLLRKHHTVEPPLREPPPYAFHKARTPDETEIHFFDKELAQSQIYIEFGDMDYDESVIPAVELYNGYFSGGMGGIVFQELREARALAYSVWARYFPGDRSGDQNMVAGSIGTQADKSVEALQAFIELLDDMPESNARFGQTKQAVVSEHRTSRIGFRRLLGQVREWERLGVDIDPRKERFAAIQNADLETVLRFYRQRIQNRIKLVSIVGPRNQIDMDALAQMGTVVEVGLDDIFGF